MAAGHQINAASALVTWLHVSIAHVTNVIDCETQDRVPSECSHNGLCATDIRPTTVYHCYLAADAKYACWNLKHVAVPWSCSQR